MKFPGKMMLSELYASPVTQAAFDAVLGRWSLIYVANVADVLARLREALVPGGRIAVTAWAPPS